MSSEDGHSYKLEAAFRQCYLKYFHKVYAFFVGRTANRETAEDLTHDLFLKLFQNWRAFVEAEVPDAYLFTLARNLLIDFYRKKLLQTEPLDARMNEKIAEPVAETPSDKQRLSALLKAVAQLPAQRQEIFKLKKLQGLSTEEVAEQLGLSQRTVENQVYRAVITLRKQLAGLFSSFF